LKEFDKIGEYVNQFDKIFDEESAIRKINDWTVRTRKKFEDSRENPIFRPDPISWAYKMRLVFEQRISLREKLVAKFTQDTESYLNVQRYIFRLSEFGLPPMKAFVDSMSIQETEIFRSIPNFQVFSLWAREKTPLKEGDSVSGQGTLFQMMPDDKCWIENGDIISESIDDIFWGNYLASSPLVDLHSESLLSDVGLQRWKMVGVNALSEIN